MKRFAIALVALLAVAFTVEASGVAVQRVRVVNRVAAVRAVSAVQTLGFGFGGYGYGRAAFVQPVIQSYSLVQPVQAFTQAQAFTQVQAVAADCGVQAFTGGYATQAVVGVPAVQAVVVPRVFRQRLIVPRQRLLFGY